MKWFFFRVGLYVVLSIALCYPLACSVNNTGLPKPPPRPASFVYPSTQPTRDEFWLYEATHGPPQMWWV